MEKLITIIIPVYKVEKYIKRCIESILIQSYTNLEIILIDDESPDKCPEICDNYEKIDKRIKVIHKKNGGAADARNAGLEIAKGELVTFVDSDDYIDKDYIKTLYENMIKYNADISICSSIKFRENEKIELKENKEILKEMDKNQAIQNLLYQNDFDACMWVKLYKMELFENIRFPKGNLYEDLCILYKIFLRANKIIYTNYIGYYYLNRVDGTTKMTFSVNKMDLIQDVEDMYKYIEENCPNAIKAACSRVISANFHILLQIPKGEYEEERKRIKKNIKKYRKQVLFDKKSRLKNKIAIVLSYISFEVVNMLGKKIV